MYYSYLDPKDNVIYVPEVKNAGLYSSDVPFKKTAWGKDYSEPRIEPDAVSYSSTFYEGARHHIPTGVRPGNNTNIKNTYTFINSKYNTMCYNSTMPR